MAKNDKLELDPVHGANPGMEQCYLCLGDKGVILWGRIKAATRKALAESGYPAGNDGAAPRRVVLGPEPCDKCKEFMSQGVILISVREGKNGTDPYRTGGWVVVKEEAIRAVFHGEAAERVLEARMAFVTDDVWDRCGLPREAEASDGH